MAAIEKLLTMGLAHGTDPRRMLLASSSTGPRGERLEWTDVQRAIVALPKGQRAALYLKAAPQLMSGNELAAFCHDRLQVLMKFDRRAGTYRDEDPERAFARQSAVVRVALDEYQDPRTCRRCTGTGKVLDYIEGQGLKPGTCGKCQGKGFVAWSDNRRARGVGVRREHWATRYAMGYDAVLSSCSAEYRAAATAFKQALFGDDLQATGT